LRPFLPKIARVKTSTRRPSVSVLICAGLGLITLALYLPSLGHGFVDYDDQQYVTENAHVTGGLSAKNFAWAFGFHAGNWHPLTWLSHMLDCQLYGLNPAGHHLTNVLLHTANTVLLFVLLFQLTGAAWRSAGVAALFGWHPLHVESVAWIAERKDVLCVFFAILTLLVYARYVSESKVRSSRSKGWYGLTLALFALALMSKPMAVTLPFVLLLLDFWPLRRVQSSPEEPAPRRMLFLISEKAPFFLFSVAACVLTVRAQEVAIVPTTGLAISQRIGHAVVAYGHYLEAMIWPRYLAVYYPYEVAVSTWLIVFDAVLLAAITGVALWFMRARSYVLMGWLWFLGTLVPVIGLVQVGDQAWADRYTYLPSIGLFITVAWSTAEVVKNRWAWAWVSVVVGVALLTDTTLQLCHWRNTRTLFEHAARVASNNYMAITMLGTLAARDGKLDQAIEQYDVALALKPDFPEAHFSLGNALDQKGKLDQAIAEYQKALWFRPIAETTHVLLGAALAKQGKYDEAVAHYQAALKLDPDSAVAQNNLARVLHTQGKLNEAIEHYTAAIKLDPKLAPAHNNLGIALLQKGRVADGARELRESLRLNPTNAESQFNLALALNQQAQWSEAAGWFRKTVPDASRDPNAHFQFALALAQSGETRQAMAQYAVALLLRPEFPEALDGLAWILCTSTNSDWRNATEAVGMAEQACELTGHKDPAKLKTLAAAYAEAGRFQEAVTTAQTARDLATSIKRDALAQECQAMAGEFKASKPWRVTLGKE
jgi:tetratricopeptide (TPR) repeat protein